MPEELVRPILEGLPATSPEWGRDPNRLRHVIGTVKEAEKAYLTQVAEQHAAPGVRAVAHLLLFKGALRECQTEEARTHLERLGKSAPDSRDFTSSQVEFQDYLTTAPGVMAPGLELPAIDGKGMVKLSSLRGKFVLVDFWATWCAPCCYELPEVHKVWARFKDANFAILSVSCDKKPEIVTAFRRKPDTPMPWHHAFAQTTRNPVCVAWGVKGIPKPVLVGPDGRVIAAGDLLRGPNLLSTLEKHLGKTGPKP
jgi:peroxiredoxin